MAKSNELNAGAIRMFNGNPQDGAFVVNGQVPGGRTAIDLWPVDSDQQAPTGAKAELVIYRTRLKDMPNFERMNWTAMWDGEPQYRFGVERGGDGQFRPVLFAFEDITPGQARIPLTIMAPHKDKSTLLLIEVQINGKYLFKEVEVGPPDSACPGYRSLCVKN